MRSGGRRGGRSETLGGGNGIDERKEASVLLS